MADSSSSELRERSEMESKPREATATMNQAVGTGILSYFSESGFKTGEAGEQEGNESQENEENKIRVVR